MFLAGTLKNFRWGNCSKKGIIGVERAKNAFLKKFGNLLCYKAFYCADKGYYLKKLGCLWNGTGREGPVTTGQNSRYRFLKTEEFPFFQTGTNRNQNAPLLSGLAK